MGLKGLLLDILFFSFLFTSGHRCLVLRFLPFLPSMARTASSFGVVCGVAEGE